jgi:hypothetical protein
MLRKSNGTALRPALRNQALKIQKLIDERKAHEDFIRKKGLRHQTF